MSTYDLGKMFRTDDPTPEEASLRTELEEINKRLFGLTGVLEATWHQFRSPETKGCEETEPSNIDTLLRVIRFRLGEAETFAHILRNRIVG